MKKENKIKVLAICGSPRKGNTEFALTKFLHGCKLAGAQIEIVLLRNIKMKMFDESSASMKKLDLKMKSLTNKMSMADLVVFGVPVFYSMPPALFKNFIDKTAPLYFCSPFKNKKVVLIMVAQERPYKGSSINVCSRNMKIFCRNLKMKIINEIKIGGAFSVGDLAKNKRIAAKLILEGKRIVSKL